MNKKYPLPRIDDHFDQMRGENVLSNIDLRSSYHQVRIKEEEINKMTFRMQYGHYEFVVLSFFLTNSPTTLMCHTDNIFNKYLYGCSIFFNDILSYSKNEENEENLIMGLRVLREHKLYAKLRNYYFY